MTPDGHLISPVRTAKPGRVFHALTFAVLLTCGPLAAAPGTTSSPLARSFAYCAGRLSADAAHFEDRDLLHLKQMMQDMLSAVIDPTEAEAYEALRIAGHVAQSELRAIARFSPDAARATEADTLASDMLAECRSMVLAG